MTVLMTPVILGAAVLNPVWLFSRLYEVEPYGRMLRAWAGEATTMEGARVLELGCGPGRLLADLQHKGALTQGLDRSEVMVRAAPKNVKVAKGDALATGLPPGGFDAVLSASLANVVSEPQRLIAEMVRLARPGGVVSLLFPGTAFSVAGLAPHLVGLGWLDRSLLETWSRVARKLEPDALRKIMHEAGLREINQEEYLAGVATLTGITPPG